MLGLFDSGRGGLNTVRCLKESGDTDDLIYLIDTENSPYGIKTEKQITEITERNIRALVRMGAERVLIACCTASTVYYRLSDECKAMSIPIIDEVANEAKMLTRRGRIGVIATEHTVRSGAFSKALSGLYVTELALSPLVTMIDSGLSDSVASKEDISTLERMLIPMLSEEIDTLVLGCTHFPALYKTIDGIVGKYGDIRLVDSARVGADALRKFKYGK